MPSVRGWTTDIDDRLSHVVLYRDMIRASAFAQVLSLVLPAGARVSGRRVRYALRRLERRERDLAGLPSSLRYVRYATKDCATSSGRVFVRPGHSFDTLFPYQTIRIQSLALQP